jgi:hypothetical protein
LCLEHVQTLGAYRIPLETGHLIPSDLSGPGGRLMIADLLATRQYRTRLEQLGMTNIDRIGLGWRMWSTGPWLSTLLVTATKPK